MKTRQIALGSVATAALLAAAPASANDTTVDWLGSRVEGAQVLPGGAPGGATALRVSSSGAQGRTVRLAVLRRPAVAGDVYALVGQVRYARVEGAGYLEMWSVFPGGRSYFSRTLATSGPLASLTGTSGWRRVELPFRPGTAAPPTRLELNLVLPGRGTVWLGPLELQSGAELAGTSAWWDSRTAGLLGAVGGSLLGLVGAAIGVLAGLGRARGVVLALAWAGILVGAAAAIVAIVALLASQPREVWFPPALLAVVAIVFIGLMRRLRQRFVALELRRIQSADL